MSITRKVFQIVTLLTILIFLSLIAGFTLSQAAQADANGYSQEWESPGGHAHFSAPKSIAPNNSDGFAAFNSRPQKFLLADPDIDVQGNGISIANGDNSPSTTDHTDFGNALVDGAPVDRTFTISNAGVITALNLSGVPPVNIIGAAAGDFTVTKEPDVSINAGSITTFTIRFAPSITGTRAATVTIINDVAGKNPYVFAIEGTGIAPAIEVTGLGNLIYDDTLTATTTTNGTNFQSVRVDGEIRDQTFYIKNIGEANLLLTGTPPVIVTGGSGVEDFTIISQPASSTISPMNSVSFTIRFNPSVADGRRTFVNIPNNANNISADGIFDFIIRGNGVLPDIDVQGNGVSIANGDTSPSAGDHTNFGSVLLVGGTIDRTFTISNAGSATLNLTGTVQISGPAAGDFTVTQQPTSPVDPQSSTTFTIHFDPSAVGLRTATVTITHDDGDENPFTFSIQGTGNETPEPDIDISGNGTSIANGDTTPSPNDHTDFGPADVSSGTITRTFTIDNTGNDVLNLTGSPKVTLSGTHAADFTVTQQPTSPINSGSNSNFTIVFDPSAQGLRTAQVSIANNDADKNPYTFNIQGSGTSASSLIYLPLVIK